MTCVGAGAALSALAAVYSGKMVNAQGMEINALSPTPEQVAAFAQLPDRPVVMVNLLKFRDGGGGRDRLCAILR